MLKRQFDPLKQLPVVLYLRMSSDDQNPRSPQQQRDTIEATLQRLGYPWTICNLYTDEGISGRYLRRRTAFQQMHSVGVSKRMGAYMLLQTGALAGLRYGIVDRRPVERTVGMFSWEHPFHWPHLSPIAPQQFQ